MTSDGTKKYSRDFRVFVYKSCRNRSPLSLLTAPHSVSKQNDGETGHNFQATPIFSAACKDSCLKPSETLKCFKLWCWVHPHSSFILHSSLRIKICTSKTPVICCSHLRAMHGDFLWHHVPIIASSRWTLKFQEKVPTKISADCKSRKSCFEDRKLGQDVSTY